MSLLAFHASPVRVNQLTTKETRRAKSACLMEKKPNGEPLGKNPSPIWLNKVSSPGLSGVCVLGPA